MLAHTPTLSLQLRLSALFDRFSLTDRPVTLAQIADTAALQNYYRAGYAIIRQYCPDCFVIINPREFELTGAQWQNFMAAPPYTKVLQDLHRCVRVAPVARRTGA